MKKTPLDHAFETLANQYLAMHPEVRHTWRQVTSRSWGDRIDLVCAPDAPNEVFATLHGDHIAVGSTNDEHVDFEDFGRGLSDVDVAREAFGRFVELLAANGHLTPPS